MFCKLFIFAVALVACVFANPQPEAKPGFLAGAAIASPYIASAPLVYSGAYAAPIGYGGLYGGYYGRTIYG